MTLKRMRSFGTPQKIAILRYCNFLHVSANSLVDRKIAKLGGYRKVSAKYAAFRTISGVGLLLILMGNHNHCALLFI